MKNQQHPVLFGVFAPIVCPFLVVLFFLFPLITFYATYVNNSYGDINIFVTWMFLFYFALTSEKPAPTLAEYYFASL
jgi:hypothetical protein